MRKHQTVPKNCERIVARHAGIHTARFGEIVHTFTGKYPRLKGVDDTLVEHLFWFYVRPVLDDDISNLRMNLPQELLDESCSHLPSDDGQSLQSCSLVSESWLEHRRRLLFDKIFTELTTYQPEFGQCFTYECRVTASCPLAYFLQKNKTNPLCCVCPSKHLPLCFQFQNRTFCNMRLELFSAPQHAFLPLTLVLVSIT